MDCQMPVMDGFSATRNIRQYGKNKNVVILALTDSATIKKQQECIDC